MGQQQLLLLVLGAIIVGAAILVGINMFSGGAFQANEDAVRQDCLSIASRLQQYWSKPTALGGGGRSFGAAAGIVFPDIGFETNLDGSAATTSYTNEHGSFTLTWVSANEVTVGGTTNELNPSTGAVVSFSYKVEPHQVTDVTP